MRRSRVPRRFKPYAQFYAGVPGFLVRTSADPLALAPAIRAELGNLHADVPLFDMATVEDRVAQSVGSERLNTLVAGAFAALALLLAAARLAGGPVRDPEERMRLFRASRGRQEIPGGPPAYPLRHCGARSSKYPRRAS